MSAYWIVLAVALGWLWGAACATYAAIAMFPDIFLRVTANLAEARRAEKKKAKAA